LVVVSLPNIPPLVDLTLGAGWRHGSMEMGRGDLKRRLAFALKRDMCGCYWAAKKKSVAMFSGLRKLCFMDEGVVRGIRQINIKTMET
jgi:hypothetical protein